MISGSFAEGDLDLPIDDLEEPKDIEIEYDDTDEVVASESGLASSVISAEIAETFNPYNFGIKNVGVLLPSFRYQDKHMNKHRRFSVNKLKSSHPEFFKKAKRPKKSSCTSKSMGGGFNAKAEPKVPKKREEWVQKNPKTKGHKDAAKSLDEENPLSQELPPDNLEEELPTLKEVTIKNVCVKVERLHPNIVKFKHKQYTQFLNKQSGVDDRNKAKQPSTIAKVKNVLSNASNEKVKINKTEPLKDSKSDVSIKHNNENSVAVPDKNEVPKPATDTEKKDKKSKPYVDKLKKVTNNVDGPGGVKSNDKTEKSESAVVANPLFDQDVKHDRQNENEKLVEILYSLIKVNRGIQESYQVKKEKVFAEPDNEIRNEPEKEMVKPTETSGPTNDTVSNISPVPKETIKKHANLYSSSTEIFTTKYLLHTF